MSGTLVWAPGVSVYHLKTDLVVKLLLGKTNLVCLAIR